MTTVSRLNFGTSSPNGPAGCKMGHINLSFCKKSNFRPTIMQICNVVAKQFMFLGHGAYIFLIEIVTVADGTAASLGEYNLLVWTPDERQREGGLFGG